MLDSNIDRLSKTKVLIYSHDTFGLGHLRRCRAIAHHLVDTYKGITVLILSGSPIIGSFEFKARVDFVRIPGVIKLKNGEYTSLSLHINLAQTLSIRETIITHVALAYKPDLFIVDKEPLGLHGEVKNALKALQSTPCINILGLRDVLDEPKKLALEWKQKKAIPALQKYYHEIWVFGTKSFYDPLQGLSLAKSIIEKTIYTGFLPRTESNDSLILQTYNYPYFLVTPGGGKDGVELIELIYKVYQSGRPVPYPAIVTLGPFMDEPDRIRFSREAKLITGLELIGFTTSLETLMQHSRGVIAMGGYNTFCEILSFNKPALLAPRTEPRLEQYIRCRRAEALGMIELLTPEHSNVDDLIKALYRLSERPPPFKSESDSKKMLSGMDVIAQKVLALLPNRVPNAKE